MFTKRFWADLTERALSTAAEAAILCLGADQLNVLNADWTNVAGFAAGGFALTVLKGVAAGYVGDKQSASLNPTI